MRLRAILLGPLLLAGCSVGQGVDASVSPATGLQPQALVPVPIPRRPPPITPPIDPAFFVEALGRMCMDFGSGVVGNPATYQVCNGSLSQQIGVREITANGVPTFHDVTLHVNGYCVGSRGGVADGAVLELEACTGAENQEFALDGDSIIAGHVPQPVKALLVVGIGGIRPPPPVAHDYVVKPQNDRTSAGTPLVLGTRQLTENEYLRLVATDGSGRDPHRGFTHPADGPSLVATLRTAGWGSVVVLDDHEDTPYDVTAAIEGIGGPGTARDPIRIQAGVTVRGDRKWTDNGPQIVYRQNDSGEVFAIAADDVRVTGLRLQGPSASTGVAGNMQGIVVTDGYRVTVDHVEVSQFTRAAIEVDGTAPAQDPNATTCPTAVPAMPRVTSVVIGRNFVHHDEAAGSGYGIVAGAGAFPLIDGNVEYLNRHSVASDDNQLTGYVARDNFVLSDAPVYGVADWDHEHDFDVHGTGEGSHHTGGFADDYVQVQHNTFLGTNRYNFELRGVPCRQGGLLDGNVFVQSENSAVVWFDYDGDAYGFSQATGQTTPIANFTITNDNAYGVPDPTGRLGVGDFDGDGVDDVFVGTGVGWYYSSGAQGEWRFLNLMTETAGDLLFGDVDGDGRSDALAIHTPGILDVSWGAVSPWEPLLDLPADVPLANLAVGNFDGDALQRADIFMTDAGAATQSGEPSWYIAYDGAAFTTVGASSHTDLRFGDFDGDGKTDVFAIDGGRWAYSSAATVPWQHLTGPAWADLHGVFVGDFDGDGVADVGWEGIEGTDPQTVVIETSSHGTAPFELAQHLALPGLAQVGRFGTTPLGCKANPARFLWWGGDRHFYGAEGANAGTMWSRQDMR